MEFSHAYNSQPLYRVMIWNIRDGIAKQKNNGTDKDEFNAFELTAALAFMLQMNRETVMNDYLKFSKENKEA